MFIHSGDALLQNANAQLKTLGEYQQSQSKWVQISKTCQLTFPTLTLVSNKIFGGNNGQMKTYVQLKKYFYLAT